MKYAVIAIGILLLLLFYLGLRIISYVRVFFPKVKKKGIIIISFLYVFLFIAAFIASFFGGATGVVLVQNFGFILLMLFLYTMLGSFLYDLIRILAFLLRGKPRKFMNLFMVRRIFVCIVIAVSFILTLYGSYHAKQPKVKQYDVIIEKESNVSELNVVMISDIHMGFSIGKEFVYKIVNIINEQDADVVFIAGDIFDNNYEALRDKEKIIELLKNIKTKYGVYACLGNHDIDGMNLSEISDGKGLTYDNIARFLEEANITLLDDDAILVADTFYVVGRKEGLPIGGQREREGISSLISSIDKSKPVFVLDHRPEAVKEALENDIDLVLSGHTHNGQLFPGNLILKLTTEYAYGHYDLEKTDVIVSSGVGYWGPAFRLASDSEIVQIKVKFQN